MRMKNGSSITFTPGIVYSAPGRGEIKPHSSFYAKEASPCLRSAAAPSAPIPAAKGLEQQELRDKAGSPSARALHASPLPKPQ